MFWNKKKYANGYSTVSVNGKTVRVKGNVTGNVNDFRAVTCGDVGGDIDARGSVRCTRK